MLIAVILLESRLRREDIDGELQAVELLDDGREASSPVAAYQGITGVREKDPSEAEDTLEDARLRKLPLRLYMEVLRLTIRGMVDVL